VLYEYQWILVLYGTFYIGSKYLGSEHRFQPNKHVLYRWDRQIGQDCHSPCPNLESPEEGSEAGMMEMKMENGRNLEAKKNLKTQKKAYTYILFIKIK